MEFKVFKTSLTFCTLPTVSLYYFGKNPSAGPRDRIEYIEFNVSQLMKIDTFSKERFKTKQLLRRVEIEIIFHQRHHFNL